MLRIGWADVVGAGADQAIVIQLFDHVGAPAADSRDGKNRREQIDINSQDVVRGR